jgi:hypothetical protein
MKPITAICFASGLLLLFAACAAETETTTTTSRSSTNKGPRTDVTLPDNSNRNSPGMDTNNMMNGMR